MHTRRTLAPAVGLVQALVLAVVWSCGPSAEKVAPPPPAQVEALVAGGGPIILGGDDFTDHGERTDSGELLNGWFYLRKALESLKVNVRRANDGTVALLGAASEKEAYCCDAGSAYGYAATAAGLNPRFFNGPEEIHQFFADLASGAQQPAILVMVGTGAENDIEWDEGQALAQHAVEIANFVNSGGGLMSNGYGPDAYGWLQALIPGIVESEDAGCDYFTLQLTTEGETAFPGLTNSDIQAGPCHSSFSGDLGGLQVLARDGWGRNIILGGASAQLPGIISLDPSSVTYVVGTVSSHTVTATVRDGELQPIAGATVTFHVGLGPNAGQSGTAVSNAAGEASFTYPSSGVTGTDLITASFVDPTGTQQTAPTVEAIWTLPPNQAPVARCQNVTVSAGATCGATASVNNGSSDPDGDAISCVQTPAGSYGLGSTVVALTCTDSHGLSSTCTGTVKVVDNQAPVLTCPAPIVAECTGNLSARVSIPAATLVDNCEGQVTLAGGPAWYSLGTSSVTFRGSDASGNQGTCTAPVTVQDTQAPTLTLAGPSELVVGCGGSLTQGVVATDVCGGNLSNQVQVVGGAPTLPGTYQVSYKVTDQSGNSAQGAQRTVTVQASSGDPSVVLNGNSLMQLECGVDTWVDPSASATDGCGGPLAVHKYNSGDDDGDGVPGSVDPDDYGPGPNTSVVGTYSVQYQAWDAEWHISSAIRTVNVSDTRAPTLALIGPSRITFTCGSGNFVDPGATASDQCYGDLTKSVQRSGWVNSWAAGTYTVTYTVADSSGNSAPTLTRTVDVVNCPW
ncbi:DUF5011 domain-containing protein [Hyalangium versicolor]|uniref:DUF5011 domain-containing protein n=1 Tax=Hyalangium versicolor TaxID=2861190 RepID=UPI001CCA3051|nr:DUF5011 domain-containing protein [Hyalangium versicolor]